MDTPGTPQSRSAAASKVLKSMTPSQIALPSTPTAIWNSKPATELPLPQTPIPNPSSISSIEKLKLAAQIPLPETPTPVAATADVPLLDPNNSTAHLPTKTKPNSPKILSSPTATPDISPLKLTFSLSQSQARHPEYRTSLVSQLASSDLGERDRCFD